MINVTLQRRPYARTRRETLVCKDAIDTCGYVRSDHRDPYGCPGGPGQDFQLRRRAAMPSCGMWGPGT